MRARDDEDHKRVCKSWFVMAFILFFKFSIYSKKFNNFLNYREKRLLKEVSIYLYISILSEIMFSCQPQG
jgi:hypothetical protein